MRLGLQLVLCLLLLLVGHGRSFLVPTPCIRRNYQPTTTTTTSSSRLHLFRILKKKKNNNPPPAVTSKSSYVPDGLTAEQYAKIRHAEQNRWHGRNLGAFGPRWNQSTTGQPGDWFTMPSLWTHGYDATPSTAGSSRNSRRQRLSLRHRLVRYGPALVLAWFLVNRTLGAVARWSSFSVTWTRLVGIQAVGMVILQTVMASLVAMPLATGLNWVRGDEKTRGASRRRAAAVWLVATTALVSLVGTTRVVVVGKQWWFLTP